MTTPACAVPDPTGIDLADAATMRLVRRIYFARFAASVRRAGIDPEDGLQVVLEGLLRRNRGRSRWDPSRGGLSTYLYVAINGLVLNMLESRRVAEARDGTVGRKADAAESLRSVTAHAEPGYVSLTEAAESIGVSVTALERIAAGEDVLNVLGDEMEWFEALALARQLGCEPE